MIRKATTVLALLLLTTGALFTETATDSDLRPYTSPEVLRDRNTSWISAVLFGGEESSSGNLSLDDFPGGSVPSPQPSIG